MTNTNDQTHPLTNPSLAEARVEPRTAEELCRAAHERHMQAIGQERWLKDVLARNDEQRQRDEQKLEEDLEFFRITGDMPTWPPADKTNPIKEQRTSGENLD